MWGASGDGRGCLVSSEYRYGRFRFGYLGANFESTIEESVSVCPMRVLLCQVFR